MSKKIQTGYTAYGQYAVSGQNADTEVTDEMMQEFFECSIRAIEREMSKGNKTKKDDDETP